ncbi:hypothetical protein CCYA_CCYA03G0885 [Cyanidiococcus yangmingshanensis]|nr:hypothetical protein CCYA_CCYA03G0885 [Cyanidiococcus yangmingshanensis]
MSARRQLRVCCEGLPRTNAGRRALRCSRLRLYAIGDGHHSSETGLPGIPACTRRAASVHRETRETDVRVQLNIDGTGVCRVRTGIPFLDHMLHQVSAHGLVDLEVHAVGDYEIDDHHTNEDVGIAFGMALAQAVGEKRGIQRFGHFVAPLDEALVQVVMDFSGRGYLNYELQIPTERVGSYDTQLVREFFAAIASNAQLTLHIRQLAGLNSHHIIEATFKAFARALRMACEIDPRRQHQIPSSKGALTDQQALRSVDGA